MTADEIVAWFNAERKPALGKDEAILLMNSLHPRAIFVKTLAHGACLLDAGAGDGGLEVFRHWPPPQRTDLRMHAYSLSKGARFDSYDGFELGRWEEGPPTFDGIRFDAVFCSHFIEHLDDAVPFLEWTGRRLSTGGRLYLEWPSPFSALLPKVGELAAKGVALQISNYHDDATHKTLHDRSRVVGALVGGGFFIEQQGYVSLPFIEEEILAHRTQGLVDAYAIQTAFWSRTRWAQYLIAVRK